MTQGAAQRDEQVHADAGIREEVPRHDRSQGMGDDDTRPRRTQDHRPGSMQHSRAPCFVVEVAADLIEPEDRCAQHGAQRKSTGHVSRMRQCRWPRESRRLTDRVHKICETPLTLDICASSIVMRHRFGCPLPTRIDMTGRREQVVVRRGDEIDRETAQGPGDRTPPRRARAPHPVQIDHAPVRPAAGSGGCDHLSRVRPPPEQLHFRARSD